MSYDLLVFAADRAPADRNAFLNWWSETAEWAEGHAYDNPIVSTPELRPWFMEMITESPAMNGPFSARDLPEDESSVTDYSVGIDAIYESFSWSKAKAAVERVSELAAKHGLGFFDVSSKKIGCLAAGWRTRPQARSQRRGARR